MRRKLRLYLDTSVWSFAFADDAPDYQRDTLAFFSEARKDRYEIFSSSIVATEIAPAFRSTARLNRRKCRPERQVWALSA